ncbi:MAG TPA: DUF2269 family protein [Anaerolineae bacterium]
MLYLFLTWLHVLSAIVALGTNLTYGIWLTQATRSPETLLFTLRTVKILDDRLANPAYIFSLITSLAMVYVGGLSLWTPWLLLAVVLYVAAVLLGIFGYSPILNRQIELVESTGPGTEAYIAVARRGTMLGILLGILAVSIVYLMVTKPQLWG